MTEAERPFPRATYRLQLHAGFGFAQAAAQAPYLQALGISHAYLSPVFAARPGSIHGYDGTDHCRLNPELGTEEDFRAMLEAFRAHGLGTILDFVPNHMGIGGASNAFWLSVLEWGPESPHAARFDIDWQTPYPGLTGKVLVPFLGESCGTLLENGGMRLDFEAETGRFSVWAHDTHKLPVCPRHYGRILAEDTRCALLAQAFTAAGNAPASAPIWSGLGVDLVGACRNDPRFREGLKAALARFDPAEPQGRARLAELIELQFWRASKFNLDCDAINYRRFFAISELAGVRVERPEIFDEIHTLVLDLIDEGLIDGIRIDHIDGLADPKGYALRLREKAARPFWFLVEKILAPDETLPESWRTDGTTGYEFTNLLIGLLVNPVAGEDLSRIYQRFTGRTERPETIVHAGKHEVLAGEMAAELEALTRRFHELACARSPTADLGRSAMRRALAEVIARFEVYRSYADATGLPPADRSRIAHALIAARRALPGLESGVFDFIDRVLTQELAAERPDQAEEILAAARRFQQLSGAIMAKGLEDTALYRFNRLIALNEVGSEPGAPLTTPASFHAVNADRLAREPRALLATSTHDTKRGEDARVRIAALSYHRDAWERCLGEWHDQIHDAAAPIDPNEEYFFYQLLLGVWPAEWRRDTRVTPGALEKLRARVEEGMLKSVREAKVNTRWVQGDSGYESALSGLIARALDPSAANRFLPSFRAFEARLFPDAAFLALAQTVLKLTVPGVPDIYQGAELWEQSLVDPDNRRPVDFALRARLLDKDAPADTMDATGTAKLLATRRLLGLRRAEPGLFAQGSYTAVDVPENASSRIVAFRRSLGDSEMLVGISLPPRSDASDLGAVLLPAGTAATFDDVLCGGKVTREDGAERLRGRDICVLHAPG